ncbi:MAG: GTP-binding protein [Cyanobacteria bacterium P01_A01_bin.135]
MSRSRLLLVLLGVVVALGALLWLVASLQQLYAGTAAISPLLARLLVGCLLLALAALVGLLVYYASQFLRRPAPQTPPAPRSPVEAADRTLAALQQQIEQVQDEGVRQALQQRSQQAARRFTQGALQVAVFGVGSVGKTSTINAIFGRSVGEVNATLGTTTERRAYRLRFHGVPREIHFIDTPGLLDASVWGTERSAAARALAAEADLVLMVMENDLQQSEYEALRSLLRIGKRLLLVLNKVDRYPNVEQAAILRRIQERLAGKLAPEDVVAIAADPAPVTLTSGESVKPPPQVLPLLKRMAALLRQEGDSLVADNILLQSRQVGEEARVVVTQQRRTQADAIIDRYQWISGGVVAVMPLPVVDLLAAAAVNAQMVIELGRVYGCEVSLEEAKSLALSLAKTLGGVGIVTGATELMTLTLRLNPGTVLVGQGVQGLTAAYLTRIAGKSFARYFEQQQRWGDGGMLGVVQAQYQLERRDALVQRFIEQAIAQVVPKQPE